MKKYLFILLLVLTTCYALAADRYLVSGGTGNWNSTTNWSATDGGASGASFPVAGDNVYLTTLSANAPMTVNVTSACATLICTGTYAGTFTVNGLLQLTGNITLLSTMTITTTSGSPELRINAGGVTFTSNGKQWNLPLRINIGSATFTLADDWYVSDFTCGITTGVTTVNGNKLYVSGNATNNITSGYVTGTTELVMNGTGTLSMPNVTTGSWRNNITINTAGTVTISGTPKVNNMTLTYTAGTVVTTGSTLDISGSTTLNTDGISWNNVNISSVGTTNITLGSNLTATGNLNLSATNGAININNYIVYAGANVSLTASILLIVGGTSNLTMNGTGILSTTATTRLGINLTFNTTGTITISGNIYYYTGTLTYTAGTMVITGSTILTTGNTIFDLGGITINNWTMSANNTVTLKSDVKIAGTFTNSTPVTTAIIQSDIPNTRRKITMLSGSTNTLTTVTATDVNSSEGLPVISNATLTNCLNWYTERYKLTQFLF